MHKLFAALRRLPKRTTAAAAIIAAAIIIPATLFAWGPDRPTYTVAQPADHVTFDSITDNPNIGDERNFVGIREAGTNGLWQDSVAAQPGKEYTVRMYVHNNAASNLNLVAQNVTAKFNLPTTTGKSIDVTGFINSTNASPQEVYDNATFTSSQDFNLAYETGTLKYYNNANGNGFTIPESVFTSGGALLGYDKMDGNIPGCFQYAGYLTFNVKPQFATPTPNFTVTKEVRKAGDSTFVKSINAMPGNTLNYRVTFNDTGATQLNNVNLKDVLPKGVTNVPGTVRILNANNPGGAYIQNGDNLFTSGGVNIGSYTAGSNAIVVFDAKVASNDNLAVCGANTLTNNASAQPEGQGSRGDSATVTVPKECQPPVTPKYSCDALTVTKIDRTNFKFDTTYTVQNATLKNITYIVRDSKGTQISSSTSQNYTQATPGQYTVQAMVTVTVNGQDQTVTSDNCKKPFEVTEIPVTPVYTCDALTKSSLSRTQYSFTGTATAEGGATITGYTFDFGDGTAPQTGAAATVQHTYQKDGTYTVKLSVNVTVNGQNKTVTDATKCVTEVTVSPEECLPGIPVGDSRCTPVQECKPGIPMGDSRCEEKCTVPGKETLPKNSPDCVVVPPTTPPTELPHTGASDNIFALLGAGSLIAAIGYYVASRRALS